LFNPSHNNDAVTDPFEPESCTSNPANLSAGNEEFTTITLSSTINCDAVEYTIDDEPKTSKFCVITNEPVII
jgi:hypothetical protein